MSPAVIIVVLHLLCVAAVSGEHGNVTIAAHLHTPDDGETARQFLLHPDALSRLAYQPGLAAHPEPRNPPFNVARAMRFTGNPSGVIALGGWGVGSRLRQGAATCLHAQRHLLPSLKVQHSGTRRVLTAHSVADDLVLWGMVYAGTYDLYQDCPPAHTTQETLATVPALRHAWDPVRKTWIDDRFDTLYVMIRPPFRITFAAEPPVESGAPVKYAYRIFPGTIVSYNV